MWRLLRHSFLLAALAAAGCGGGSAQVPGASSGLTLTEATRDALDRAFDKWEIAPVDPQSVSCQAQNDGASSSSFVRGDLNSDGLPDLALAVKTPQGVRLVAVFERTIDSLVVDVDSLGQTAADGALGIQPRGSTFKNPGDGLDDYFTAETIAVSRCGQPRTLYFWSGLGFRKVVLAPSRSGGPAALLRLPQHAA